MELVDLDRVDGVGPARYDAVADFYDAGFSDPADPAVAALLELLGPPAGLNVLDIACGHGRVSRELARRGATVTGVDLSRALLDKAEAIEAADPLEVRYLHADVADVPAVPDAAVDVVVCNHGLADIDDLDGALATVHRVLRSGGSFVFSILHPCFPGAGPVSGAWPSGGRYHDEGFWIADGAASTLRRQVGANHRMLSSYVNSLARHGLPVTRMSEPVPPVEWNGTDRHEAARFPVFLVVRCTKAT
ncbi:MAG TPA: class I SAM-dependent methyltransferase [Micromonosporaceae bacterium]